MPKIIELNSLNLKDRNLVVFYKNNRNTIYRNKKNNNMIKIFIKPIKPNHNKFLLELLTNEKFCQIFCPNLISLIVNVRKESDSDLIPILKGYIMKKGRVLTKQELYKYLQNPNTQKIWKRGMKHYKFYYNDFKSQNLIWCPGRKIGLIDLEAIRPYPTREESEKFKNDKNIPIKIKLFGLKWYYNFLKKPLELK